MLILVVYVCVCVSWISRVLLLCVDMADDNRDGDGSSCRDPISPNLILP